jgi:ATP synthase regulation protein NCA2
VSVSSKPLLHAPVFVGTPRAPAPKPLADVADVPLLVARSELRLHQMREFLRADALHLGPWRRDPVGGARHATAMADAACSGLVRMPAFARAPSRLRRHWVAYSINTAAALAAMRWLYRNSALAGSDNLQRWACKGYRSTLRGFRCACAALRVHAGSISPRARTLRWMCRDNVVRPLSNVRDEFFETFSARAQYSESSRSDFEASKASLQRMLDDFERDVARTDPAFAMRGAEDSAGMPLLLQHYELELKRPIRNMFTGHLPRSLLIQARPRLHHLAALRRRAQRG